MSIKSKIAEELAQRVKGGDSLAMDYASRMQRARDMGFDTDTTYYHGTGADFDSFREGYGGVYFSDSPSYADRYTGSVDQLAPRSDTEAGRNIIPTNLGVQNTFDTRIPGHRKIYEEQFLNKWGNATPLRDDGLPDWVEADDFQEFFDAEGLPFDSAIVGEPPTSMPDGTFKPESSLLVTDESKIRSVNAAFDPAKKGSSNLLASMGAGTAVGAGLMGSEEAEAGTLSAAAKGLVKLADNGKGSADIIYDGKKVGGIEYQDNNGAIQILRSDVDLENQGIGTEAYKQFIDSKVDQGFSVGSDSIVSDKAAGLYNKLSNEGYDVKQAEGTRRMLSQGQGATTSVSREDMKAQYDAFPAFYDRESGVRRSEGGRIVGDPVFEISKKYGLPVATATLVAQGALSPQEAIAQTQQAQSQTLGGTARRRQRIKAAENAERRQYENSLNEMLSSESNPYLDEVTPVSSPAMGKVSDLLLRGQRAVQGSPAQYLYPDGLTDYAQKAAYGEADWGDRIGAAVDFIP